MKSEAKPVRVAAVPIASDNTPLTQRAPHRVPNLSATVALLSVPFALTVVSRAFPALAWLYYITVAGFCVVSLLQARNFLLLPRPKFGAWAIAGVLALSATLGILNRNFSSFWMLDVSMMSLLLLTTAVRSADHVGIWIRTLVSVVAYWMSLAIPVVIWIYTTVGLRPGNIESRFNLQYGGLDSAENASIAYAAASLLLPAVYLAPFASLLRGYLALPIPFAVVVYTVFGLVTASRGAVLLGSIAVCALLWVAVRDRALRRLAGPVLLAFVAVGGAALLKFGVAGVQDAMELLRSRTVYASDISAGRFDEHDDVIGSGMVVVELAVGRGMGAAKDNLTVAKTEHGVPMVHFGYLHLILKGGVVMLLTLYGIALVCVIRLWRCGGLERRVVYIIFAFIWADQLHTQWQNPFPIALFSIALSCGLVVRRMPVRRRYATTGLVRTHAV
jgi:hypothetical protein